MKFLGLSDLHGDLPIIKGNYDAVIVAGDIVPLPIQRDIVSSIVWFSTEFVNWCMKLDCEKIFLVGGNHDLFLEWIIKDAVEKTYCSKLYAESFGDVVISRKLMLPEKIVYLQDSSYNFHNKIIYGTPWCPELKTWAFYKNSSDLTDVFKKIKQDVDILITHAPGHNINDTGISLQYGYSRDYGSNELRDAVLSRNVKCWLCGHVHSGNHTFSKYGNTDMWVANVSIKDEDYKPVFKPLVFEI